MKSKNCKLNGKRKWNEHKTCLYIQEQINSFKRTIGMVKFCFLILKKLNLPIWTRAWKCLKSVRNITLICGAQDQTNQVSWFSTKYFNFAFFPPKWFLLILILIVVLAAIREHKKQRSFYLNLWLWKWWDSQEANNSIKYIQKIKVLKR